MTFFRIALFCCFVYAGLNASAQQQYKVACIGFYNLENLYDTINDPKVNDEPFLPEGENKYTGAVYRDKLSKLEEVLSQIATDVTPDGLAIVGVAEIENSKVLEDLIAQPKLVNRNYKIIHYDSPDKRGVDVGLLYNPKYFTPLSSRSINVPLNYPTRDILWVTGLFKGDTIHVSVNHWPSRRGGEERSQPLRNMAAGINKAIADSLLAINPDSKIIVMGDLNDNPTSPSVAKVIAAKTEKEKTTRFDFFNPFHYFYKKGIGTLAWRDSWSLFDQILITGAWLDKEQEGFFYHKAVVFNKEFMTQRTGNFRGYPLRSYVGTTYQGGYSDHFPTYIVVLKKDN